MLQLVLLHCPSKHPRNLCPLLLVNTTCRNAVQQARAHCVIDDNEEYSLNLQDLEYFVSFATWLPKHSGLVSKLKLNLDGWGHSSGSFRIAVDSFTLALQLCAEQARQTAAGQRGSPTGQLYPPPLQLEQLSTDCLLKPPILELMPVFALQHLSIVPWGEGYPTPAASGALARITSLRSIDCSPFKRSVEGQLPAPEYLVNAIKHLTCLTRLSIVMQADAAQHLPASMQVLNVGLHAMALDNSSLLGLQHMTSLAKLNVQLCAGQAMQANVPSQGLPLQSAQVPP